MLKLPLTSGKSLSETKKVPLACCWCYCSFDQCYCGDYGLYFIVLFLFLQLLPHTFKILAEAFFQFLVEIILRIKASSFPSCGTGLELWITNSAGLSCRHLGVSEGSTPWPGTGGRKKKHPRTIIRPWFLQCNHKVHSSSRFSWWKFSQRKSGLLDSRPVG